MRGETEEWRAVRGHELRYQVSDRGRVRLRRARIVLDQKLSDDGVVTVLLQFGCEPTDGHVGVLVAEAFHGAPPGLKLVHLDGNVKNNRADNVRWQMSGSWRKPV